MRIFLDVNPENNRVLGWGSSPISQNSIEVVVEDDHDVLDHPFNYVFIDREVILDEEYRQQQMEAEEFLKNKPKPEQEIADLWYAIMTGSVNNA